MGDRYELELKCAYCQNLNKDIWYAPTCNSYTFECEKCKKTSFITADLKAIKLERVTLFAIREGFLMCSNANLSEEQIDNCCKQTLKEIEKILLRSEKDSGKESVQPSQLKTRELPFQTVGV